MQDMKNKTLPSEVVVEPTESRGRLTLTLLAGGKGDDANESEAPQTVCPHCREHEFKCEQAEQRKAAWIEYINGLIKEGFGHESSNGIGTAAAVLNGGAGTR
jgi:hypothetical protein